jgi:glucose/arabinose dehydrogenase
MRRPGALTAALALAAGLAACTSDQSDTGGPDTVTATESAPTDSESATTDAPTRTAGTGPSTSPSTSEQSSGSPSQPTGRRDVRVSGVVARNLEVPWGLGFLPGGAALVNQRNEGVVSLITPAGRVADVHRFDEVATDTSEGGLLGLAVSPDFTVDHRFFVYLTTAEDNRVISLRLTGRQVSDVRPVLTGIPRGTVHDGGQLRFGPDGHLYVATGETGVPDLAADPESLAGKILRITPDGDPAPGNPDADSPVWTLGHRNVQGLAFDDRDRLWATEFGSDVWDELSLIEAGRNYGWPVAEGNADLRDFADPRVQWRPEDASPSSVAYADGSLWVASLRGARLWEVPLRGGGAGRPTSHFIGEYGRLRAVAAAPDGTLWLTTSNRDGRGEPAPQDDRILRVSLTS